MYTDAELIEGCLRRKRRYQRYLYNKYAVKMLGVCMRYIRDQAAAEDVLQDGFIAVFLKLETFRHQGSLEGWIRRIMINHALLHIRQKGGKAFSSDEGLENLPEPEDPDVDSLWNSLSSEQLFNIIHTLPDGYRTVFLLYVLEDYSHSEIGELLGISEGTSKSQLSRAREMLKTRVREFFECQTKHVHG